MAKELEITLSKPIKYSKDGDFLEESILILRSPTTQSSPIRRHARRLKNLGLSALRKSQEMAQSTGHVAQEVNEDAEDLAGADFMNLLGMAGVDTEALIDAMKALAPHVISIGESEEDFKPAHWEKLSMDDEEEITGKYLTTFLLNFEGSDSKK